jgi:hypothetical protein
MRNVSVQVTEEIKTENFVFISSSKIVPFFGIVWENIGKTDGPEMTI